MTDNGWRFWVPVVLLLLFSVNSVQKLVRAHVDPKVVPPRYTFTREQPARRGSIYSAGGEKYPLAQSVPCWEYRLDPLDLVKVQVQPKGEPQRSREAIVRTIADALGLNYQSVLRMANTENKSGWRNQYLATSSDPNAYRVLSDRSLVSGVRVESTQVRQYLHGRRLAHVLGSVNAEFVGSAGIEQRYNRLLTGTPGTIQGMMDARQRELYERRKVSIDPIPGSDIFLTIDHNIQFEVEDAMKWGLAEYGAGSGWAIVMDSQTGAILAMASFPDFNPERYGRTSESERLNRAIGFNYEPGSVMKVITAAAAMDSNPKRYGPNTVFRTNRDDPNYFGLPGDGSHVWDPTMTLQHAIVHSSNIVIGKLAYDLGPTCMYGYLRGFGFGQATGIELPGEESGILWDPAKHKWDLKTRSRVGIGQGVAVTALQLISAYQAIANDGKRMKPYLVDKIVSADGEETYRSVPTQVGRPISAKTSKTLRTMMLDVASPKGTARRAAIRGYSVAGKTGTAQKATAHGYSSNLYRASFCGIVPASDPRLVILVTLDFDQRTLYHQGGNSAGPIFKRIAMMALRYLDVQPDRPEEYIEYEGEDEFDRIMEERAQKYGIIRDDE